MNFFGHAVVASWCARDPGYVLGAMVPDFSSIISARMPVLQTVELEAGAQHHQVVDAVFHDTAEFRALCADSFGELSALGLERGRSRAVAHVGIEILLDEILSRDSDACRSYKAALEQGAADRLGARIGWTDPQRARFEELRLALRSRETTAVVTPEALAYRLERTFRGRVRLRMTPGDLALVLRWAPLARRRVGTAAERLLGELCQGLSRVRAPTPAESGPMRSFRPDG